MKCKNALKHEPGACWNHVLVSCERAREALIDTLLAHLDRYPATRTVMLDAAWAQMQLSSSRSNRERTDLERELVDLRAQSARLAEAIAAGGKLESLVEKLKVLDKAAKKAEGRLRQSDEEAPDSRFPKSKEVFKVDPRAALLELARTSFEFGDLMRKVFPKFVIHPVQALDSGLVRPRAHLTLDVAGILPLKRLAGDGVETETVVIDLFDPPLHIKHLVAVTALKAEKAQAKQKHSLEILARELKIGRMTVKRALTYQKLMTAAGLNEPYRVLSAAPAAASRWKPRLTRIKRAVA